MLSLNYETIDRQVSNLQNKGIIYCWETYKFRSIKIPSNRKQYLQYCLNFFYHDVDDVKKRLFFGQLCIGANM